MDLIRLPPVDPSHQAPPILPLGAKVVIEGERYTLIRSVGHQQVFERADRMDILPLSWNQYIYLWGQEKLRVVPSKGLIESSKARVADIPFEFFSPETQRAIHRKHFYCLAMERALIDRVLRCRSKGDVKEWLKSVPLPDGCVAHPSRGTVMRDYKFYLAANRRRSVLAHGNAKAIRESVFGQIVVDIIYDVLESFAAPNPELSLANIQNEIAEEIARRIADGELIEDRVPARSTISTYAKKLNQYEILRLTEGTYEADRQFQPKGKIVIPDFPHSRWEIDHTLLPIKVAFRFTDYHGVEQTVIVGKVWCTAIIDASTRYILALVFGIDPPSSLRTMQALRMAVTPKSGMFIEYGIDNRLDVCMLPVCAVMDNGKDLHSNTVASAMSDLGITQVFAGVYRGDHKPYIERFFRTFKAFLRKFPGSTPKGLPKGGPKRRDAQPAEPMTLQQLERFGWKWTSDTYHTRPHAGLHNESPLNVMTSGIRRLQAERNRGYPAPLRSFSEYSALDVEAMFSLRMTLYVDPRGVRFENLRWNSGALRAIGEKHVQARINPKDLGTILVLDPKTIAWVRVPSTEPFYATGRSLAVHRRVWARIVQHEKDAAAREGRRASPSMTNALRNEGALLREILQITGQPNVGKRKLRDTVAVLGRSMDIAIACTRLDMLDARNGIVPAGLEAVIDLEEQDDGTFSLTPKDIPREKKKKTYDYPAPAPMSPDDDGDVQSDPIAGFNPEAAS